MEPMDVDDTYVCDACGLRKPLSDYTDLEASYNPHDPSPIACRACRSGVTVKQTAPLTDLQQKILHLYVVERVSSIKEIAKRAGCAPQYVSQLLSGRADVKNFRQAARLVFEEAGVDVYELARGLKESLHATKKQWNKETGEWDEFPDFSARGSAQERAFKLFALYEKDAPSSGGGANVAIQVVTNVGSDEPYEKEPGVYTIDMDSGEIEI